VSGRGAPELRVEGAADLRVGVVASRWHDMVMGGLLGGALRALGECVAARLATTGHDAVVALGVVIRGGTPHFDYVCRAATDGLLRVSLDTGVPVGFGVLTCDDEDQAIARAGLDGSVEDKGYDAATAAVATALTLRDLRRGSATG
jgi:6,7-dimethyl-8-ribityllumazine synthase